MREILANKIRCKKSGDIIESKSVYDFRFCKCDSVAVDGGHDYLRRQVELEDWEDLYQVETGALNRAVKRNIKRFPESFCFQLSEEEYEYLRCQTGISSLEIKSYGGRRY